MTYFPLKQYLVLLSTLVCYREIENTESTSLNTLSLPYYAAICLINWLVIKKTGLRPVSRLL